MQKPAEVYLYAYLFRAILRRRTLICAGQRFFRTRLGNPSYWGKTRGVQTFALKTLDLCFNENVARA